MAERVFEACRRELVVRESPVEGGIPRDETGFASVAWPSTQSRKARMATSGSIPSRRSLANVRSAGSSGHEISTAVGSNRSTEGFSSM